MSHDSGKPNRRSIRLRGYDYTRPGFYFVTVKTQDNIHLFGNVADGVMHPNELGNIVRQTWRGLPQHYPGLVLDAFVLMPNHIHGIIVLTGGNVIVDPVTDERWTGIGEFFVGTDGHFVGTDLNSVPTNQPTSPVKYPTLGEIMRGLKTFSTRRINELRNTPGLKVWQGRYYERIARNNELKRIRWYIANNPRHWKSDPQ